VRLGWTPGAIALVGVALLAPASASGASATAVLRLDGIGPLHLGMTRTAAVATGWLGQRGTGCELGGRPFPITYRFTGRKAPRGIAGVAEFQRDRLADLSFTRGVRTSTGVTVGSTTTKRMVSRYRQAGFSASARFEDVFQGTFVTIKRRGDQVVGGFGERGVITMVAIPAITVCE
jgi:hypothetical protein